MNELSTFNENTDLSTLNIENPYEQDQASFDAVSGSAFLPILQLCTGASEACKSDLVPMNNYALRNNKDDFTTLGREVDVLFITWRPRALDLSDKSNIRSSFQPSSDLFREIKAKSTVKNSNCMCGPEYLVYVPSEAKFATFYMGGTSARNESRKTHALFLSPENKFLGGPGTLKSRLLENKDGQKWQSPYVVRCSTPFEMPSRDEIIKEANDFLKAKEQTGLEKVETSTVTVDR